MPSCNEGFKILKMLMRWISHTRPFEALNVMSKTFKQLEHTPTCIFWMFSFHLSDSRNVKEAK